MRLSIRNLLQWAVILLPSTTLAQQPLNGPSPTLDSSTTPALNVTVLTGRNHASALECWQFSLFTTAAIPGISGSLLLFLGNMANATYSAIPPRFNGGLHHAPVRQLVFFVSGLIHITLPQQTGPNSEAWIQGGKYGFIYAEDTADISDQGHITTYPSDETTVALVVPLDTSTVFKHKVLYNGPCQWSEMVGL